MDSTAFRPAADRPPAGATALGSRHEHRRHLVGNALRATRVFAEAAFSVVVLGRPDPGPDPAGPPPHRA
jgi:hypothetical protein